MKQLDKLIKDCEYNLKSGKANYLNSIECDYLLPILNAVKKQFEIEEQQNAMLIETMEIYIKELAEARRKFEWISVKKMNLSHLKEGDSVLTLDDKGNMIPYKFFFEGLNMIGEHNDNNRTITHLLPIPSVSAK